jgi:hypothetical protein
MPFQAKRYRSAISLSGMDKHIFQWRVVGPEVTSAFQPTVVAQFPAGRRLAVEAKLHIEIRKKVLGVFYRVYAISDPDMSLYYVRAPNTDAFIALNPKLPASRVNAILLGKQPVEPHAFQSHSRITHLNCLDIHRPTD